MPGVGDKTAAKWISEYGGLDGIVANVDKIKGRAGENLRAHLANVLRNYDLNALVCDLELSLTPQDVRWDGWDTRGRAPGLRRARVPGPARAALFLPGGRRARGRVRLRPGGQVLRAGQVAAWLGKHAGDGPGRRRGHRHLRPRHRHVTGIAVATGDGPAAWFDPAALDEDDETRRRRMAGRPGAAQGDPRRQAGAARLPRARLAAGGASPSTRPGRLPGPPRPAGVRLDRPGPALPQA